ncbi:MAG: S8 family serine peptidase [Planctomycetota bacterium]
MRRTQNTIYILVVALGVLLCAARLAHAQSPRTPWPKPPTITEPAYESRLTVKFQDDLMFRANPDGSLRSDAYPPASEAVNHVNAVATTPYGLSYQQMIDLLQTTLDFVENRAEQQSGFAQPDLAGMMVVYGAGETIELAAQALLPLAEVEWVYFSPLNMPDPCEDIHPDTPDFYALRAELGIKDYHSGNPGLDMACAWDHGARGQGIRIADCETGYIRGHEDLCDVNEPEGQEMAAASSHGTAVLGILGALDNSYGWTGLVPEATLWFFTREPEGVTPGPEHNATAITNAIATVSAADVLLLEIQTASPWAPNPPFQFGLPGEIEPAVWVLTCVATHSDIIVVAAAGNGYRNLDLGVYADYHSRVCDGVPSGDSGAIIVGAGTPDTTHAREDFSTYGERVNLQGWGRDVFTLGYGDYANPGYSSNQLYTHTFNGTSSASPFVAGAAAAIQSLILQFSGDPGCEPLTPSDMRTLLVATGIDATQGWNGHNVPFPNMAAAILELGELNAINGGAGLRGDCTDLQNLVGDCDEDGIPDKCELDCNDDDTPDECDQNDPVLSSPIASQDEEHQARKNRYISIDPSDDCRMDIAIRVHLSKICSGDASTSCVDDNDCADPPAGTCIDHPHALDFGDRWVGEPYDPGCFNDDGTLTGRACTGEFVARVVGSPVYRVWPEQTIHVGDCEIAPVTGYLLDSTEDETTFADPLAIGTILKPGTRHYGDVVGVGTGDLPPLPGFTHPNRAVNVSDVQAFLLTKQGSSSPSAHTTWVDLHGLGGWVPPNFILNVSDLQRILFGIDGQTYLESGGHAEPWCCPTIQNPDPCARGAAPGDDPATFTLVPSDDIIGLGESVDVDVFVDSVDDLGAFELAMEVTGGTSGELTLTAITVDSQRQDYVFEGQTAYEARNMTKATLSNSLESGSVQVQGSGYLATYTYQPTSGASGVFTIAVKGGEDSFLNNGVGVMLGTQTGDTDVIGVGIDCFDTADCAEIACQTATCTDYECIYSNVPQGTPCDDGLYCTATDECNGSGTCVGSGTPCGPKNPQCCETAPHCICDTCLCGS